MWTDATLSALAEAARVLGSGFDSLPPHDLPPDTDPALEVVLRETAERMRDNFPYFHPLYAGQMIKPPHPVARAAYALALSVNPNNHALDGGRASSRMEKEAVAELAAMLGWPAHLGHLCSGGTLANLEALWIAGRLAPGRTIVASDQAHYTHRRLCAVLGLPFECVPVDAQGRMRIDALEEIIARGQVGAVVATVGTTATGAVDPLDRLVELRGRHGFRLHADAAYGGYFRLVHGLAPATRAALDALADVDSAVVDPHKHGLQPYGCGCILFRDPSVGAHYRHDSPYTYFTSAELHLGEISLECSRPGAAAVALWATQRLLPLRPEGTFARDLARCHQAALALHARLRSDPRFITGAPPELDLVTWLPTGVSLSEMSQRARAIFDAAARRGLHLALADLPPALFADAARAKLDRPPAPDRERVTALRSCLMKPEHVEWIDRIWTILDASAGGQ